MSFFPGVDDHSGQLVVTVGQQDRAAAARRDRQRRAVRPPSRRGAPLLSAAAGAGPGHHGGIGCEWRWGVALSPQRSGSCSALAGSWLNVGGHDAGEGKGATGRSGGLGCSFRSPVFSLQEQHPVALRRRREAVSPLVVDGSDRTVAAMHRIDQTRRERGRNPDTSISMASLSGR